MHTCHYVCLYTEHLAYFWYHTRAFIQDFDVLCKYNQIRVCRFSGSLCMCADVRLMTLKYSLRNFVFQYVIFIIILPMYIPIYSNDMTCTLFITYSGWVMVILWHCISYVDELYMS